jgi:hypothetical protein
VTGGLAVVLVVSDPTVVVVVGVLKLRYEIFLLK